MTAPQRSGLPPSFVASLFDRAAAHYDGIDRWLSLGSGVVHRRMALRRTGLGAGMTVLDVACGTGLVTRAAVRLVGDPGRVVAIDPSAGMLAVARRLPGVRVVRGTAEQLPVADDRFDVVTMGYALRHVSDLEDTFREYRRVLRPGGRVLVLEIMAPESRAGARLLRWYLHGVIARLTAVVTGNADAGRLVRYYWDTIAAAVAPAVVIAALETAGFIDVRRQVSGGVLNEFRGTKPA